MNIKEILITGYNGNDSVFATRLEGSVLEVATDAFDSMLAVLKDLWQEVAQDADVAHLGNGL